MNKPKFITNIANSMSKAGFKIKVHSPEILVIGGAVGVVVAAVMACKSTLKVKDILSGAKSDLDAIHSVSKDPEYSERYSQEDEKKDTVIVYAKTGLKLVKLYAPSVLLGAASLGAMVASNDILRKRNAALATAYATINRSFKEYRKRVAERFGEEAEREIRYNIKAVEIQKKEVDENGNEVEITETKKVVPPAGYSEYYRIFDETNPCWQKDHDYNLYWLRLIENRFNDQLKAEGHVFLNDVYRALGFDDTKYGQVVGWIYDPKNPNIDNFVDFGLGNPNAANFSDPDGIERSVILDFNVDGYILNKIDS